MIHGIVFAVRVPRGLRDSSMLLCPEKDRGKADFKGSRSEGGQWGSDQRAQMRDHRPHQGLVALMGAATSHGSFPVQEVGVLCSDHL